jgi:hypothetical protein
MILVKSIRFDSPKLSLGVPNHQKIMFDSPNHLELLNCLKWIDFTESLSSRILRGVSDFLHPTN